MTLPPTLLLVDWQRGLDHPTHWGGARSTPEAERNGLALLARWREWGWPVVHVFHDSTTPGSPLVPGAPGHAPKPGFEPVEGERVHHKSVNSGFIGTTLDAELKAAGAKKLVICGLTTQHCVSTTVRMAGNLGFDVRLVGDACGAHPSGGFNAETVHAVNLAVLDGEFCTVVSTAEMLAETTR